MIANELTLPFWVRSPDRLEGVCLWQIVLQNRFAEGFKILGAAGAVFM
jgi:hypothetical protein